jgi:hypothetical protein
LVAGDGVAIGPSVISIVNPSQQQITARRDIGHFERAILVARSFEGQKVASPLALGRG